MDNTSDQPSKFKAKNWIEINENTHGTCKTNSQIKFKTSMLKSSLYNYNDGYIFVKETITVPNTTDADAATNTSTKRSCLKIVLRLLIA